jgi:hypothetical protein
MNNRVGLAIGIASIGRPSPVSWGIALATQVYPPNTKLVYVHVLGDEVDNARNRVVEEAKKANVKYLWFNDDDTIPPSQAANSLMYLLDQHGPGLGEKVMVAGGIYCMKVNPPQPLVFMESGGGPHWKWKVGDTFKCWGVGTGCMMINMDVFDYLDPPYFKTVSEETIVATDDLYFCQKVHDAGFEVMADGGVLCQHWDVSVTPPIIYTLPSKSYPLLPKEQEVTC